MNTTDHRMCIRMVAVIALYKMQPCESIALSSLRKAISYLPNEQAKVKILLYDNTPGGQAIGELPDDVLYKANPENGALSAACNYALEIAEKECFEWLITLNQDTDLPQDFLSKLLDAVRLVSPMQKIAGVVPRISSDGRVVSPYVQMRFWTLRKYFQDGFVGISTKEVHAANSASMIKVSALKSIGGFDPRFSLDLVDFDIDHRLYCNNMHFFVAGNIHVGLELSSNDLKRRSSPGRYEDYLRAEEVYCDEYFGRIVSTVVMAKLIYRICYKLWCNGGNMAYRKIAFKFLCRRLFCSKTRRKGNWKPLTSRPQCL